ncbi:MAG: hypothetical protein FWF90_12830 [Promicromonosporaceae bacterium]|nr:hypothetical protein [Promicromonosporaceae bacterium]
MTPALQLIIAAVSAWVLVGGTVFLFAALHRRKQRRARARKDAEREPLDTLVLQVRLGQMAAELQALADSRGFAVAHHTRAAQAAYDALLAEACRRAGLPVETPRRATERATEEERLREELELASRGWSW